ncbi:MAG: polyphosphate kinase 1 [Saprospiraceae bacterium]
MENNIPYIQRDISWLSFNYRVLQEAKDLRVPLMERIKFLAIYSSNLDEFFRVRVANHRNLVKAGKKAQKKVDFDPEKILIEILRILKVQQEEFSEIYNEIIKKLKDHNVNVIRRGNLSKKQKEYIEKYFYNTLLPYIQPILLDGDKIKPFLTNASIYLAVELEDKDILGDRKYALIKVPSQVDRFLEIPSKKDSKMKTVIVLDDIIRHSIKGTFPGYNIIQSYSIKLTRDAELYIDDEFSGNLIAKIKEGLKKRNIGEASRMVYDRSMSKALLRTLTKVFSLSELDLLPEGRYHNNFDFFKFPTFGKKHLIDQDLPQIHYPKLEGSKIWSNVRKKDHLIHVPYHSYQSVINFFEQAAIDPNVSHIKITQYRVAKKSRIMAALMKAVKNGKQVFVFIEIKARFDEEANLDWGEKLEEAGVKVQYSIPGIKVHSKLGLIIRKEGDKTTTYAYISTGNFHEKTAKLYSDVGLFTANRKLTKECLRLFNVLETKKLKNEKFKHLGIGKFNLNKILEDHIEAAIASSKLGEKSEIFLKMNSLQDEGMIRKLYEASQEGVKINLIIRGICSIVGGMPEYSDNIDALSIVDRYLEHARIFIFIYAQEKHYYISSADWMYRNLHRRIEMITPVYDETIQQHLQELVNIQIRDNVKSRSLNHTELNTYRTSESDLLTQAQIETYYYIKRITEGI